MTGFQVLLIGNSPAQVTSIERLLRDSPFSCTVAPTLAAGIARVTEERPDLVFLDLVLPDSEGMATFRTFWSHRDDIPVVILTALDDEAVAQAAVAGGAQDYVMKGAINARALQRVARYAIERHRFAVDRRALEQQLAQSRQLEAIGQLAAGIAHEINTPTQYVSDNARFLCDAFLDITKMLEELRRSAAEGASVPAAKLRRMLEQADTDYLLEEIPRALHQSRDGLGRITRIVQAMKAFSHPSLEEKVPTDLNQALETTLIVTSNEWKYVAEVTTAFDPELPPVACFPGELNQVFLNLIVNAAHAIAEVVTPDAGAKGRITVSTALLPDGNAEIRIADTGCGITNENRFRVFDPFFTTKGVGKGTGQGLAIAYNIIVKKHRGTIDFESTPGQGTSFFIRLPVANGAFSPDSAPVP